MLTSIVFILAGFASAAEESCPIVRKDLSYEKFADKALHSPVTSFEFADALESILFVSGRDKGLKLVFEKGSTEMKTSVVDRIGTCKLAGFAKLLREAAASDSTTLRAKALWSICSLADERYADQVKKMLDDPDHEIRVDAAICLSTLRRTEATELEAVLQDPDPRVRLRIAYPFVRSGGRCCRQLALDHLGDKDLRARTDSIGILGGYGDTSDLPALEGIINSTAPMHSSVRWVANVSVWSIQLINSTGDERKRLFMDTLASNDDAKCRALGHEYKRTKRPEELAWLKQGRKKYGAEACKWDMERILH